MFRLFAGLLALSFITTVSLAAEEPKKVETEDVSFSSADGVDIQGTLYKSAKGGGSPVVMFLHSFGKDPNQEGWKSLAITLAQNGYTVLRFDYRGHGKSTDIGDPKTFWKDPVNIKYMPTLANKVPQIKKLTIKDVTAKPGYFPHVVNDIMAARVGLDKLNDAGKVNTSSVYIVGATDAATLGLMFIAAEWSRPQVIRPAEEFPNIIPAKFLGKAQPAGRDIAGAIWLSAERHQSVSQDTLKAWVAYESTLDLRDKNPMLFLYGAKDPNSKTGAATAKFFVNEVLVAKPPKSAKISPLPFTEYTEVKDTANVGVNLLGNKLGTEETILKYLEVLQKDRKTILATPTRSWVTPPIVLGEFFGCFKN